MADYIIVRRCNFGLKCFPWIIVLLKNIHLDRLLYEIEVKDKKFFRDIKREM